MSTQSSLGEVWDTVIVGGGPAGLSAALLLGRCTRKVLLCDEGKPRNARSHALNGFLTRDGSPPAVFLQMGRQELERYPNVELRRTVVSRIETQEDQFLVTLKEGDAVRCRTVLLATGVVDELPKVEGINQLYGFSVHSCPFCHGWECRGQRIAVLGETDEAAQLAQELTVWSDAVVLCTQGRTQYDAGILAELHARQVAFEERVVVALEQNEERKLSGLRFADGGIFSCDAVFVYPSQRQHSHLAFSLGCKVSEEDGCLECGDDCQTCVPGVFAAGNASKGIQLVVMAAAEGTRAAVAINDILLDADTKAAMHTR